MSVLFHDSGIPSWLSPTPLQLDYFEERIAEQVERERAVVALTHGWWLYPQVNMISDRYQQRIRCGYSAHNWHLYMRSGWYWAKQAYQISRQNNAEVGRHAKGRMDTSRSPVNLRVRATEACQPHKLEVGGSTPSRATSVLPDRCGYDAPAGGRPAIFSRGQRYGQPGTRATGFSEGLLRRST